MVKSMKDSCILCTLYILYNILYNIYTILYYIIYIKRSILLLYDLSIS